ncbi:hypothetical protein ONZ51_g12534 [Trametes cubensis]|uniref:Uncharacterized protein n=1 Tax=Trametes cubensis TaxID=1111947 RepID=A0AAD7TIB1_9APHY|nr:hypothetical protein ONZ51_g12534 [Trametes cubensis]
MWSKISNALKRPETPAQDIEHDESLKPPSVLNAVFNQHPNLSNFHEPIFKRTPKTWTDNDQAPALPIKLSIPHLKKVKSSIQPNSASSDASSSRASIESSQPRQSQDSLRSPEIARGGPNTPTVDKFNSLRSILRDPNTPATGQSVRFFSRDAYKIISPDVSAASSDPEPVSFGARIKATSSTPVRPTLQDVFSPPQSSLMKPLPSPNASNPFEISQEMDVPPIPISKDTLLLDHADTEGSILRPGPDIDGEFRSSTPSNRPPSGMHDRSQSFSFGQTVFHSLANGGRDSPVSANSSGSFSRGSFKLKGSRSRAYSDTVFHSFAPAAATPKEPSLPEADIDDRSTGNMVVYTTPESPEKEKDPFGANARAYYTAGTGVPPTPPSSAPAHGRKASREEDLILSLRTQLALQTELCAQYEVDLGARDELMRVLQTRLDENEKEMERRKNIIRGWRKRVAELERCINSLQDEVDRSREESMERSVMDEASGQALRTLHRRIEELEREKAASEKREQRTTEELKETKAALNNVQEELARRDEAERELKDGIARAKEQMEMMDVSMEAEAAAERSRAFSMAAWEEERKALTATNEALRTDNLKAQTQLADAREEALRANNELEVLKAELEAQWRGTEAQTERIAELERERDEVRAEVEALNARISEMENEWTQAENRKNELDAEVQELWAAKEELEKERNELDEQLRAEQEHSEELTRALREREDKVTALEHEQKFAQERVTRLETRLREREAELAELNKRQTDRETDAEAAQSEIAKMKREHARIVNEQSRTLQDVVAREVEARAAMEAMVREKAESDVQLASLKERSEVLSAEVERLRRQVHDLQQESADKEVKLVGLEKQRKLDKEDIEGLNIALDSKQQELEMLKRRLSVRGTAGSTPASAAKVQPHRRESSIFATPSVVSSRPPSALSDTGSSSIKDRRMSETPSTATKSTLGKSVRANGTASTSGVVAAKKRSLEGSMGPPPVRGASATASATATPTRIPSGPSARSTPSTIKAPAHQRRVSTSTLEPSKLRASTSSREKLEKLERLPSVSSASETEEKENSAPSPRSSTGSVSSASSAASATNAKATRRMSAMPAHA